MSIGRKKLQSGKGVVTISSDEVLKAQGIVERISYNDETGCLGYVLLRKTHQLERWDIRR